MRRGLLTLLIVLAAATFSAAQGADDASAPHAQHQHADGADPSAQFPLRESSGTAWQPDATPMHGVHLAAGAWEVMLHGNVFAQFLYEPGDYHRTGGFATRQVSSVNWGMAMARRPVGAGRAGVRGMISLEPWTSSDCGYLNVLATGEICEGDTIHDRQHPHDVFMELAADYDRPVRGSMRWQVYAGLAGEPALGPGGFPHRVSAMSNPVAPIGHHWLDSTHITFGLVTTGVYDRRWKAEMSVFNGREPDATRYDFDLAALDSVSARVWLVPTPRLALQVSAARLEEAEAEFGSQPRGDLSRATASATYHRPTAGGLWAVTAAYGLNAGEEALPDRVADLVTHAALLEGSIAWSERHTLFGRAEIVGKPAHDLHAHEFGAAVFTVGRVQVGYERRLASWRQMTTNAGVSGSVSMVPPALAPRYSGRAIPGFGVFLAVRPARHATEQAAEAR